MLSHPIEPSADLVADIRKRLGPICERYSADEFTDLVRQIASVRAKYDAKRAESFFDAARALAAQEASQSQSLLPGPLGEQES
jgi:hypothetical protein